MAAPLDYGDRYPSDLDDVPPGDPTAGFQETDYDSEDFDHGLKARKPRTANPDLGVEPKKLPPRFSYTGLITRVLARNRYQVIRQDGFWGVAYGRDDDGVYDGYVSGAYVTMIAGPIKDQWLIVGTAKNKEESFFVASNSTRIMTNNVARITFPNLLAIRGDVFRAGPGSRHLVCEHETIGMYRFTIKATVRVLNPTASGANIRVESACTNNFDTSASANPGVTVNKLQVDRRVGLDIRQDTCAAVIGFDVPETDYVFQTQAGGGIPIWSDSLSAANYVEAGSKVPQGWLKARCSGAPYLWLGHGSKELKLRFPNNEPGVGRHLIAQAVRDECVQLKWSAAGGNGSITACYCYYEIDEIHTWVVEDGLIVSGPGITAPAPNRAAFCNSTPRSIWSC